MYERLPETIRVSLDHIDLLDYHVLVVPVSFMCRDFFLVHETTGITEFMFGSAVKSEDEAAIIAEQNAPNYVPFILEREQEAEE